MGLWMASIIRSSSELLVLPAIRLRIDVKIKSHTIAINRETKINNAALYRGVSKIQ